MRFIVRILYHDWTQSDDEETALSLIIKIVGLIVVFVGFAFAFHWWGPR